jgi:hypothetical protein
MASRKGVRNFMTKLNLPSGAVSQFNEPDLLDDLLDHWTSTDHVQERQMLVRRLQVHQLVLCVTDDDTASWQSGKWARKPSCSLCLAKTAASVGDFFFSAHGRFAGCFILQQRRGAADVSSMGRKQRPVLQACSVSVQSLLPDCIGRLFLCAVQGIATSYSVRVTFISGDVHVGAFGCFQAHPKQHIRVVDPKFMLQVGAQFSLSCHWHVTVVCLFGLV